MAVVDRFLWRHGDDVSAVFDRQSGATYVLSPLTLAVLHALLLQPDAADSEIARILAVPFRAEPDLPSAILGARSQLRTAGLLP